MIRPGWYGKNWGPQWPQLHGALQFGSKIETRGWTPGFIVRAGTHFCIHGNVGQLFTVADDVKADSDGFALLEITPELQTDSANGALLYPASPTRPKNNSQK